MKIRHKILVYSSVIALASCGKSFLDVNNNPNAVADAPVKVLLPNTLVGMAFANGNELGKATGLLMQYNSGIIGNSASYDTWILGSFDNAWSNEIHANTINNLGIIVQKSESRSRAYTGIAKLQLAYSYAMVTDIWGDVPYSESGKGLDEAGFPKYPQPRFDEQKDIYTGNSAKGIKSLFDLVREGLADIAANGPKRAGIDPGPDDVVYAGDFAKWTRFGNSLLLKFALQVSNRLPDTTTKIIKDIVDNNKPFISALDGSQDFIVPFSLSDPNPYYLQDIGGSIANTQMLSTRFLALERSLNDSLRLSKLYIKPAPTFVGYDNGSPIVAPAAANRSYYGTYVLGATRGGEAPIRLITAFRNQFILAEAVLRFGVPGNANTYFQNGIRSHMQSTGMTTAEIDAYFAANPTIVTLSGTDQQKLSQIIIQKYIASVGNAIESYNDYRRTGLPVLAKPIQTFGDDPNTFPNRFPYTIGEGSANSNQPNPRPLTSSKVWWAL